MPVIKPSTTHQVLKFYYLCNMEAIKWVKIYECLNRERAYVIKALLESNGIEVILQGIEEENLFPGISFGHLPLLVKEKDRIKAERLIQEFFKDNKE